MLTSEQQVAFNKILTLDKNYFLTGYAGTGKSYLVQAVIEECNKQNIKIVICSTTWSSAVDIGWATYHSTFWVFGQYIEWMAVHSLKKDFSEVELIIIDEISMMWPDMMDLIDKKLRHNTQADLPFGGIKLLIVWDKKQLWPIYEKDSQVTLDLIDKYKELEFTSADAYKTFETIELKEIQRSKDEKFIALLNRLRDGDISVHMEMKKERTEVEWAIYIANSNKFVDEFNANKLNALEWELYSITWFSAWEFKLTDSTTPYTLQLKIGARIMVTKNLDLMKNGDIWTVQAISANIITIFSDRLQQSIDISRSTFYKQEYANSWEFDRNGILSPFEKSWIFKDKYDEDGEEIEPTSKLYPVVVWKFTQFPIKLAWGMTVHKSQGKTFEKIVMVIQRFQKDPRLLYVWFSRWQSYDNTFVKYV